MANLLHDKTRRASRRRALAAAAALALATGCGDDGPAAPDDTARAVTALRAATERYHDLDAAIADGFVFLHGCESRPGEGDVGAVYVHPARLADGVVRPDAPEALIYEPNDGDPALVGVELVIPYAAWTAPQPPTYLGQTFQPEDEFGVFGLHVWVWRDNPRGLFAEGHPGVSC